MVKTPAFLFDYGNTLRAWSPRRLYSQVFSDPVELEVFLSQICTMDWHSCHDAGRPLDESIRELSAAHPNYAWEIGLWRDRFGDMLGGEIPGMGELLIDLERAGRPLAILTNMPGELVDVCFDGFGHLGRFSDVIVSGFERVAKPDPAIYEIASARLNRSPQDIVFIDDAPANVAAATRMGFQAFQFYDAESLRRDLASRNLAPR